MKKNIGWLIVAAVVLVSAGLSFFWLTNKPRAHRKKRRRRAVLVQADVKHVKNVLVKVDAMGTVMPAREVVLSSLVSGEVMDIDHGLIPGGVFKKGQQVVSIDARDYVLRVQQAQAELNNRRAELEQAEQQLEQKKAEEIRKKSDLEIEKARQELAKEEAKLLRETLNEEDRYFVLRKPQLASAKAAYDSAKAARVAAEAFKKGARVKVEIAEVSLSRARLDLERTRLKVPIDCVVIRKSVELGKHVAPGSELARLAGTASFWVEILLPVDELRRILIPGTNGSVGSKVTIFYQSQWGSENSRTGTIIRLAPDLEEQGRMAKVIVEVKDPLSLSSENQGRPKLLLGSYVSARIRGTMIEGVIEVPRTALHEGNHVWVMTPEGTLDIRKVKLAWAGPETVYVSEGVKDGEMVVTSDLNAPVQGMRLRLPGKQKESGSDTGAEGPVK